MSDGRVTSWVIPLAGHKFDLEDLPRWFAGQAVHVAPYEDGFALTIPAEVVGDSYEPVHAFAGKYLGLVNGVGRLLNPKFRVVSIVNKVLGLNSAGVVCNTVIAVGTAEMRVKAGSVRVVKGDEVQPDPGEGLATPLIRAAAQSVRAHDALVILGRENLTWSEIYLLFELVEEEVGGQMVERGWITEADATLLTHTANSYSTLRAAGRHGKERGAPPANPMPHATATELVRRLVLAWLQFVGSLDIPKECVGNGEYSHAP